MLKDKSKLLLVYEIRRILVTNGLVDEYIDGFNWNFGRINCQIGVTKTGKVD